MINFLTSPYILILFWIGFVALAARYFKLTKKETVIGWDGEVERYYWLFAFIAFLPIIIMAGNRNWYIGDTLAYKVSFETMPTTFGGISEYLSNGTKDIGFYFISSLFKVIISTDPRVYLFAIAFIQGLILVFFFRRYSPSYLVSLFMFIASADYLSWMFNGIRQFLAVTIVLLAMPFVLKKRYILAIVIILFAASVHQTALIMIPIIFIVQGQTWNKRTIIYTLLIIIALFFLNQFTDLLENALSGTQYKNVFNDIERYGNKGTSFFRVLVYSIPAIMSFIFRKTINSDAPQLIKLSANMCIISAGLYIVSMFTSGIFIGRLPIYCSLFGYIFLPWVLKKVFVDNERIISHVVMVVLYLIYYYVQIASWGLV